MKKFDYSSSDIDVFYKTIYPLYSEEFLFGNDYKLFVALVEEKFILNSKQWKYLQEHWERKDEIIKIEKLASCLFQTKGKKKVSKKSKTS